MKKIHFLKLSLLNLIMISTFIAVSNKISAISISETYNSFNKPTGDTMVFNDLIISKKPGGDTTVIRINEREFLFINKKDGNVEIRMNKIDESENQKNDETKLNNQDSSFIEEKQKAESIDSIDKNLDSEKPKEKIEKKYHKTKYKGFEFEWGFNNFVDNEFSLSRIDTLNFMDLNTNRSWNVNFNFPIVALPIFKNLNLVSGLGLEYNNYFFDNKNTIIKDNGYIKPMDLSAYNLSKSKLTTLFLRVPLLFDLNFFESRKRGPFIQGGMLVGLKLSSHTKYVYLENGNKKKIKDHDDFNINWIRYGFITRLGYNKTALYMTYYPTSIFEKGKGPELYPINIGLSFLFD